MTSNGSANWTIYFHPIFEDQLSLLIKKVQNLKRRFPDAYKKKKATKILIAINQIIKTLSIDPTSSAYRQGKTLGDRYTNWRRVKFFQQYRLFFRFNETAKVVVIAWVNDDSCLRAYESRNDAYKVFTKMLDAGEPPSGWEDLLEAAEKNKKEPNFSKL